MNRRGFGWLPDLPRRAAAAPPDWNFGDQARRVSVPAAHSNSHLVLSILDQGTLGCCVPSAGFQAIRMSQVRQGAVAPRLGARLMGYYLARAAHGMESHDSGTHLRTFFWVVNRFGFCPEESYPAGYDVARFAEAPPVSAYHDAYDQRRPTRYWAITEGSARIDEIKRAVTLGYGVTFGCRIDDAFADGRIDPAIPLDPPTAGITYGHAMLIDGFDGDTFSIVNSWGEEFGDRGRCLFSADYLLSAHSIWVVELSPRSKT